MSIDYTKHGDKRLNNPTMENRNFFVKEEAEPYLALYPRDPSLDPQLVWKGKDQQDREELAVPTVPIYIQEKIHPAAIIDDLRKHHGGHGEHGAQMELFSDFNGIDSFDKEIDFYRHEKSWANRMILGDSLLVMNSLAEKEGLKGKVQCIYIDPPYGIKFGSNWQVSTRRRDVKDGKAEDAAREPEVIRAFRDTWKLGIHSYLSYLRDRFTVARDLLTETGSIFVQIGDENLHLVRSVLDEVFGSENHCSVISFQKTGGASSNLLATTVDYLLWYARARDHVKFRTLFLPRLQGDTALDRYDQILLADGRARRLTPDEVAGRVPMPVGRRFQLTSLLSEGQAGADQPFTFKGHQYRPRAGTHWKTSPSNMSRLTLDDRIELMGSVLRYRRFADDFPVVPITDRWESMQLGTELTYVVQTSQKTIERCVLMATDPGDLVLDPTCGSGTTAYVAEQWGRRWITIDTSRVALALARTRLMAARYPFYLLADSPEGLKKEAELTGQAAPPHATGGDVKKGFVYERVPHVTLKSIANNPDIREGMSREEIDKAILRHAETEYLYDKPYGDSKRVRVAGPFTVESLSPHRVLPAEEERPASEAEAQRDDTANDFVAMVLDNLRKAGVQNTKKGERLSFDDLQPHAGRWIHARGSYSTTGDTGDTGTRTVAVSVGPEFGAVGPQQVKEAAKEAMQGLGHDILIVCGYAFDPHVGEEAKQYGALTVLPTKMTADLQMGDELLKKTGAGNLFMVFGEPDILVSREGGQVVVTIRGIDIFDPTTGEIRSGRAVDEETGEERYDTANDVACWFIDTNYNGESFFVRHAYFTGAQEPYEKLKKALRAEVDEAAWASLYSTVSRPFDAPETGKIAVKVINHYGDEVLKVYELGVA